MKNRQLKLLVVSLFLSASALGYIDLEFPQTTQVQQSPFSGRIVVTNTSSHVVEVYLRGNLCRLERKNKKPLVDCGSMFLSPNEQSTFFLDGKNVKQSQSLWLVLKYPDAFLSPTKEWYCYNKFSAKVVNGVDERITSFGFHTIEIRDTSNMDTNSVSCVLNFNPNAI